MGGRKALAGTDPGVRLGGLEHRRLVEPFCGGLSVSLGLRPCRSLVNDINPHLINFFRQLQAGLYIDIPMENDKVLYYRHRDRFNHLISNQDAEGKEAASLFYFLNRTCFNGLCRFNRKGLFNVPFGRYATIPYERNHHRYKPVLAGWTITQRDFAELELQPGDFVYADPPYDVEFKDYSKQGFSWSEQERLVEWLAKHPGPVLLSNQVTDRIVDLYQGHGFELRYLYAPRSISRDGNRTPAVEVLGVRNLDSSLLPDTFSERPQPIASKSR